jgi:hypothetical protein
MNDPVLHFLSPYLLPKHGSYIKLSLSDDVCFKAIDSNLKHRTYSHSENIAKLMYEEEVMRLLPEG